MQPCERVRFAVVSGRHADMHISSTTAQSHGNANSTSNPQMTERVCVQLSLGLASIEPRP
ncbi:uncharacterized protein SEPMUDRAFT_150589 [Sphaerulina musiva SO2202]|uniref:Uncharacterized protein n=1 Tax=Sphaerulina musiva (strain SO2202) TaxID=692275 RepID=N1QE06_SPHMS|nr:uncharacterized protein SEPMUDRAFT_150589 [Sphaerulina musiva SO2202]EMF10496.1 hypothetical protein SEPMUDRAFT_150589 [Sphaerulina musiva SO2202]